MIGVLLSSLLGFGSSMLPSVIKCWQDKKDKQHELAILKLQLETGRQRSLSKIEAIGVYQDAEISKVLYRTYHHSGNKVVDFLIGMVRPVIAYGFFGLYVMIKVKAEFSWTEADQVIFAGIISFFFGARNFYRANGGNGVNGNGHSNGNGKH